MCWGLMLVYQLPARKLWVPGKGWVESCFIPCPRCNVETEGEACERNIMRSR